MTFAESDPALAVVRPPAPRERRPSTRPAFDVHRLYRGPLAKPVPATVVHVAGLAAVLACTGLRAPALAVVPLVAAGWAAWTLFEYALHRWILHSRNPVLWRALHKQHHAMRVMEDPDHRILHPFVAVPLMAAVTLLVARAGGPPLVAAGFWAGYVVYELIHWVHHDARLTGTFSRFAYFRRRVEAHHDHHFRRADTHYGFTTSFWDRAFGTARRRGGAAKRR